MLHAITLSLALVLSSAPADLGPAPAVETPVPVECADAKVDQVLAPILVADIGDPIPPAFCSEDCDGLPDISCSGTNCSAKDRNCPYERGEVVCDGVKTECSQPCPGTECDEDDFRIVRTGQCCDCSFGGEVVHFQQCVGGQWVTQGTDCGPSASCPICP